MDNFSVEIIVAINKLKDDNGNCSYNQLNHYLEKKGYNDNELRAYCVELANQGLIHYHAIRVAGPRQWQTDPLCLLAKGFSAIRSIQAQQPKTKPKKEIGF